MRRPAFQFYTGDWQGNAKLKRCTKAEKGIWIDTLCLLHDSEEEYGVLRWPLKELAQAVGCRVPELAELRRKGVMKGADVGERCKAFIFTPRHGGREGEPVTLIPEQDGPIWYSSRMVRDEYIRQRRGGDTRFEPSPKATPNPTIGDGKGDGPSASTSSSITLTPANAGVLKTVALSPCPHLEIIGLYHTHLPTGRQVNPKLWNGTRARHLQVRWREDVDRQSLDWWTRFFGYCAKSRFLTGQVPPRNGQKPFEVSLDWIVNPTNFAKILEGAYNGD